MGSGPTTAATVAGKRRPAFPRRALLVPLAIVIVGIALLVIGILPFHKPVEASDFWHEDYLDKGEFVIHGRISYEGRPQPDPQGEWVFRLEEKVSVESEWDLGDKGDEVFFRCRALDFVLADENAVKATSGPLSVPPPAAWAGVALIITGMVLLVLIGLYKWRSRDNVI